MGTKLLVLSASAALLLSVLLLPHLDTACTSAATAASAASPLFSYLHVLITILGFRQGGLCGSLRSLICWCGMGPSTRATRLFPSLKRWPCVAAGSLGLETTYLLRSVIRHLPPSLRNLTCSGQLLFDNFVLNSRCFLHSTSEKRDRNSLCMGKYFAIVDNVVDSHQSDNRCFK